MATYDLSRSATDFRKRYAGVRMQQGRVLLDDDWNENERLQAENLHATQADVIGGAGSPDQGFRILNPALANSQPDFDIHDGTFYLGGQRLKLDSPKTYQMQYDWLQKTGEENPGVPADGQCDLAYLELWQQPVTAVEDRELMEPALGGPDTSVRVRTMHRVRLASNLGTDQCHEAWEKLRIQWHAQNQGVIDEHNQLVPDVSLKVEFNPGSDPEDLCNPPIAGGYLGAENQAIRVQLVDAGHLTWGFNNASPLYRVTIESDGGQQKVVVMQTQPKDQAHWPLAGQIVEILPWSAVLPNLEKVSEIRGHLSRVESSFNPDQGRFTLVTPVPAGFGEAWKSRPDSADLEPAFYYLRVWDRGADLLSDPAIAFQAGQPVDLGHTGLKVTISGPDCVPGDFWIIAARPETPTEVTPWLLQQGMAPQGVRRYYAPLAIIQWKVDGQTVTGKVVSDCRDTFLPLVQQRQCCTRIVGDGVHSHGEYNSIQDAINSLSPAGGQICILPGEYKENLIIEKRQHITLQGCGRRTRIKPAPGNGPALFIVDSQHITVQQLAVEVTEDIGVRLLKTVGLNREASSSLDHIVLNDLDIQARDCSAIVGRGGSEITVVNSRIQITRLADTLIANPELGKDPAMFMAADDLVIENNSLTTEVCDARLHTALGGLQIGGGSDRVMIRRNVIAGGNGNGITLGSFRYLSLEYRNLRERDMNEFMERIGEGERMGARGAGGNRSLRPFRFSNGCIFILPDFNLPEDENGEPLEPISEGSLSEISILENRIQNLGSNGIASAQAGSEDVWPAVEGLTISGNEIRDNLNISLAGTLESLPENWAQGGVVLAEVSRLAMLGNVIENNGKTFLHPVCGVFALYAEGARFEGNRILNNGPRHKTQQKPVGGRRGGIVIRYALPQVHYVDGADDSPIRPLGEGAVKVHANFIMAPEGRALHIEGIGPMAVEENQLSSFGTQGVDLVTVITKYIVAMATNTEFKISLEDLLGGAAVAIINHGISYEWEALSPNNQGSFSNLGEVILRNMTSASGGPEARREVERADAMRQMETIPAVAAKKDPQYGGSILFHHNQVVLDMLSPVSSTPVSSVLLISGDDIAMLGNQCECVQEAQDWAIIHALTMAFSLRMCDNRFKEGLGSAYSAITLALLNHTMNNQGTHCFLAIGPANMQNCVPNRSIVQFFGPAACEASQQVQTALGRIGFAAYKTFQQ